MHTFSLWVHQVDNHYGYMDGEVRTGGACMHSVDNFYGYIDAAVHTYILSTGACMQIGYFHGYIDGVDHVFVDHPCFHHLGDNIYGGDRLQIAFRCALLCKAALEAVWHVPCGGVHYGDDNLVYIANDWHTALLPVYLQV